MALQLSHNQAMGDVFTLVVVGSVALFVLVGVLSWLAGGSVYDEIGEGGLSSGTGAGGTIAPPPPGSPAEQAEREQEIREMLQARSDRLVRRGEQALDIDAEVARLARPGGGPSSGKRDAALVEEVRQLVTARNERRVRRGEQPLDVDAEVQRTLAELDPEGSAS